MTEPLSILLNPYRPLPLAGVVFSPPSVGAARSVKHHWGKDIRAREGVNNNAKGASLATVVRIYQLKDRKAFDSTDYPSLFAMDSQAIKADLVAEKDIRLRPGESFSLDMPMEEAAQFVAVAGMFMAPDQENNTWRLVITRDELDPDTPRIIEASNNSLTLQPLKDD
ncbi:type VI secretion system lipoprotein TssJ [Leclercia adecarboxylata]|uniref:type VI secretion system lipoprotein TssJ n=1 Tax=Leclercia adecarboxylata TaxID=83655 RepID=UPI003132EF48